MIDMSETEKATDPFWRSVRSRLLDLPGAGGGDDTVHRGMISGAIYCYSIFSCFAMLSKSLLTPPPSVNATVTSKSEPDGSQLITMPSPNAEWRTLSPVATAGTASEAGLLAPLRRVGGAARLPLLRSGDDSTGVDGLERRENVKPPSCAPARPLPERGDERSRRGTPRLSRVSVRGCGVGSATSGLDTSSCGISSRNRDGILGPEPPLKPRLKARTR